MKRFTQIVCLVLMFSVLLAVPVYAEDVTPRASNYFGNHSVYLSEISSTQFRVYFNVTAVAAMEELGASVITVQRSTDRTNWENVKTYTKEAYTNLIGKNTGNHSGYVTYTRTSGYYYRAYIRFYAKNSSGTAYYSDYSSSI